LVTVTDPYQVVIQKNIYDANGNVIKKMDAKGVLSADTDADRYGWLYTYDLANRLVKAVDPELAARNDPNAWTTKYKYNPAGETVEETDALGNTYVYTYDNAGRLTKVTDPLGVSTTYLYDKAGNKVFMIDGRGKVTRYTYGAFGLLKEVKNANNKTIAYLYDLALNVAVMIDRKGYHTRYSYDNRSLLSVNLSKRRGMRSAILMTKRATGSR
jgi:YD repeat-containing protein